MALLNVSFPVETMTSLVGDVQAQLRAGRLKSDSGWLTDIGTPTNQLGRLADILRGTTHRQFLRGNQSSYSFASHGGEKCIFAIETNEAGPAIWTDGTQSRAVEGNTVLVVHEGAMEFT
ncbi:hypothetical protein DM02DRAFT_634509 [Periconia macrospinosa]|uniref:Uncharacterized protein n=1 Tax=Periconia macrospinosa TaxID=97972 RepID=A0A2V1D632_9PLEO|nr:hypothetical protein DM02DRAFT_634509 [Periconia macrospinosa]